MHRFEALEAHEAATGSGSSAITWPSRATANPPSVSRKRLTAAAMSVSSAPTTQRLWLSWPTDEAIARASCQSL